jgi:hypothetical protein
VTLKAYRAPDGVMLFVTNEGPRSVNVQHCWVEISPDGGVISLMRGSWPRLLVEGETEKMLIEFLWEDLTDDQVSAHVTDVSGDHWHATVARPTGTFGWVHVEGE